MAVSVAGVAGEMNGTGPNAGAPKAKDVRGGKASAGAGGGGSGIE